MDVSVIIPIYNEEETLPLLVEKVCETMRATSFKWEMILVNDGSSDKSEQILLELVEKTPELKPVLFRRNYGQTAAMQAGFDHAEGEVFVTMDGDLQNDPADIPRMIEKLNAEEADIVSGWRKNRKDEGFRKFLSRQANKILGKVTGVHLHDFGCSLKVYRKEVMENVRIYGELHRFIPAVVSQYGAKIVEMEVNHSARQFGVSKYGNMGRMVRVFLDILLLRYLLQYRQRPMHAFGTAGIISFGAGGLIGAYLTLLKILTSADIGGRPLLLLAVLLIVIGVQMIGMGIIGEMLLRIYHEPAEPKRQYSLKKIKVKK